MKTLRTIPAKIRYRRIVVVAALLIVSSLTSPSSQAQTLTVLHAFTNVPDGGNPNPVIRDAEGNLFGTTMWGGIECAGDGYTCGTVFKVDSAGNETVLYRFRGLQDGALPVGGLVEDAQGNLYGTTEGNGAILAVSTVFKLDPTGKETVLYRFDDVPGGCCADATLVLDPAGNLYGTSPYDGQLGCGFDQLGCGTVYKVTQTGKLKVLHVFDGNDGSQPAGNLVRDAAGNLYGAAMFGGNLACAAYGNSGFEQGCGTLFKINTQGNLTLLHTFTGGTDGSTPLGLIQDAAGNLYGIAQNGGDLSCYAPYGCGTVFKVDSHSTFSVLYTFTPSNTIDPIYARLLVRDAAGNLYGAEQDAGANNGGMVFKIDTEGNFSDLFDFPSYGGPDGADPVGILRDSAGNFYGALQQSGDVLCGPLSNPEGCGTVFKLTLD